MQIRRSARPFGLPRRLSSADPGLSLPCRSIAVPFVPVHCEALALLRCSALFLGGSILCFLRFSVAWPVQSFPSWADPLLHSALPRFSFALQIRAIQFSSTPLLALPLRLCSSRCRANPWPFNSILRLALPLLIRATPHSAFPWLCKSPQGYTVAIQFKSGHITSFPSPGTSDLG